jgi:hypothetical protein
MMVRECMSICYVLFWIVVVPAIDPTDLFVERVAMFTVQLLSNYGVFYCFVS